MRRTLPLAASLLALTALRPAAAAQWHVDTGAAPGGNGSPPPDGGPVTPDGGTATDGAGALPDGANPTDQSTAPDGPVAPGGSSDGCACSTAPGENTPWALVLLLGGTCWLGRLRRGERELSPRGR